MENSLIQFDCIQPSAPYIPLSHRIFDAIQNKIERDYISNKLQQTLAILDKLDIETEKPTEEEIARKFGYEEDYLAGRLSKDVLFFLLNN